MRCGADEGGTSLGEELFVSAGCLLIELKCLCEMRFPSILLSSEDRCLPPSSDRESAFACSSCSRRQVRRNLHRHTQSLFYTIVTMYLRPFFLRYRSGLMQLQLAVKQLCGNLFGCKTKLIFESSISQASSSPKFVMMPP
jgi:hypothetical protein